MRINSGIQPKPLKIVVYGIEGVGKTTFASKFPDPLFIDTEGGSFFLDVNRTDTPKTWQELLGYVAEVASNPPCATLVIDTIDWAEQLCNSYITAKYKAESIEGIPYGRGYTYVAEEMKKLLDGLTQCTNAGVTVLVLAHAQIKKFEQPDEMGAYDRWELKLQKKCAPLVKEWADMLLFANFKADVMKGEDGKYRTTGGKQRRMYASHTAAYDAKNRLGLDDELPFDFDAVKDALPHIGAKPQPQASATVAEVIPELKFEEVTPPEIIQLKELMSAYQVNQAQLQAAVGQRPNNPYSETTPIGDYDIEFIRQVLLPNFEAIADGIHNVYPSDGIPF